MRHWIVFATIFLLAACGDTAKPEGGAGAAGVGGSGGSGGQGGEGGTGGSAGAETIVPTLQLYVPAADDFFTGSSVPVKGLANGAGDRLVSIRIRVDDGQEIELLDGPVDDTVIDTVVSARRGANQLHITARTESGGEATTTTTFYVDGGELMAPEILSFTATPEQVLTGEEATLRWKVIGTNPTLWIDGVGAVPGLQETRVTLPESRTFVLRASNELGSAAASVTVEMGPEGGARLRPWSAEVAPGARVPLYVQNAPGAALTWSEGAVTPAGAPSSLAIWTAPQEPGRYEVTVQGVVAGQRYEAASRIIVRQQVPLSAGYESAGGNSMSVEEPEARSAASASGDLWALSPRLQGVFHGDATRDRWVALPAPPFAPEALVRLDDGTLFVGHGGEGVARLLPGATSWGRVASGPGSRLATHGADLYRLVSDGQTAQVERFDDPAWTAVGPALAMSDPGRYVIDSAGDHWVARRSQLAGAAPLVRLRAGGDAWGDAGVPLALVPMLQAGPGGRILAARAGSLALFENGSWSDLSAAAGGSLVSGLGFLEGGAVMFSTFAAGSELLHVQTGPGTFATPAPALGGVRLGCRLHQSEDGTIWRIGLEGVYGWAPAAGSWRLFGGRGLAGQIDELHRSRGGTLGARSSGFHLLQPDGTWRAVPTEAAVDFSWTGGSGGFGLLLQDGSLVHVSDAGEVTPVATLDPTLARSVFGAAEGEDGTVVLHLDRETLVLRPGATAPAHLPGGDGLFRFAAGNGRIWGVGGGAVARLEPSATGWQPGITWPLPAFGTTQAPAVIASRLTDLVLTSELPCLVANGGSSCEPLANHLFPGSIENVAWGDSPSRVYASGDQGIFALQNEAWIPLGSSPPVTRLVITAADGWIYGRSAGVGLWRVPGVP